MSLRSCSVTLVMTGVLSALVAAASQSSQTPPQRPPTFRTDTVLVPVEVRVIDTKTGKPITDLTKADFTIYENGIPQQIRHFSHDLMVPAAVASPLGSVAAARPPLVAAITPDTHRTFLILLGRGRLQDPPIKGVDGMIHLVRDRLLPQDRVAVFAYDRATPFTTDHEQIAHVLESFKERHDGIEAQVRSWFGGLAAIYGSRDMPKELRGAIDGIFAGPGATAVKTMTPGAIVDAGKVNEALRTAGEAVQVSELTAFRDPKTALSEALDPIAMLNLEGRSFDDYVADGVQSIQDLSHIYAGINYLRFLDGEKHLFFVTPSGLSLARAEDAKNLAATANKAHVTIDILHTAGVAPGRDDNASWAISDSETMAERTGGQYTGLTYADKFVDQVDDATRAQYVIGYAPPDTRADGTYRTIDVRVNRRGVTLLYRHGYSASVGSSLPDSHTMRVNGRLSAAATFADEIHDIVIRDGKASNVKVGSVRSVKITLTIPAEAVTFTDLNGVRSATLEFSIFCADKLLHVVGSLGPTITMNAREDVYQRLQRDGLPFTINVPVKNEADYAKVVVYDAAADRLGSVVINVR